METIRGRARNHAVVIDEGIRGAVSRNASWPTAKLDQRLYTRGLMNSATRFGPDDCDLAESRWIEYSAGARTERTRGPTRRCNVFFAARKIAPRPAHKPTFLETALLACDKGWVGVLRTGSNKAQAERCRQKKPQR